MYYGCWIKRKRRRSNRLVLNICQISIIALILIILPVLKVESDIRSAVLLNKNRKIINKNNKQQPGRKKEATTEKV